MNNTFTESKYPIDFRKADTEAIADLLLQKSSIELVGMKRVGISNFLRYLIYNQEVRKKYFNHGKKEFFIVVDLNDLIEREIFAFWRLTFKRLLDSIEESSLSASLKTKISQKFEDSIQSGDLFLTIDGIRESLTRITTEGYHPTIFFIRFDRIIEASTKDFFNNLQSLISATGENLTYVFTSTRKLSELAPNVFDLATMNVIARTHYLKPTNKRDTQTILRSFTEKLSTKINKELEDKLIKLSGGHVQYLQFSIIILNELKPEKFDDDELLDLIESDERISLQSEELFSSLTKSEQKGLIEFVETRNKQKGNNYLSEASIIIGDKIFSKYFTDYVRQLARNKENSNHTLTKKEHLLFTVLSENTGDIISREDIVKFVWPEYSDYGVSDWSIDRLVARLRKKLEHKDSKLKIETIKTRGFRLIES